MSFFADYESRARCFFVAYAALCTAFVRASLYMTLAARTLRSAILCAMCLGMVRRELASASSAVLYAACAA